MNIHKSQLFWCELQGIPWVLTHCHIKPDQLQRLVDVFGCLWMSLVAKQPDFPTLRRVPSASRDSWPPAISTVPSVPPVKRRQRFSRRFCIKKAGKMHQNHQKMWRKWWFFWISMLIYVDVGFDFDDWSFHGFQWGSTCQPPNKQLMDCIFWLI